MYFLLIINPIFDSPYAFIFNMPENGGWAVSYMADFRKGSKIKKTTQKLVRVVFSSFPAPSIFN